MEAASPPPSSKPRDEFHVSTVAHRSAMSRSRGDTFQLIQHLRHRHYIPVLRVDIEQVRAMRRFCTIAHRGLRYDTSEPKLHGIACCGSDATARRRPANDHRVDAQVLQQRLQVRSEER